VDAAYVVLILAALVPLAVALDRAREAVAEERERDLRADERGRLAQTLEAWGDALALMVVAAALEAGALLLPALV
jgi:hypothetical protein